MLFFVLAACNISGMNLASYLEQNNLTATVFAQRIGVAIATVTRAARGEIMPSPETMRRIIDATDGQVTPNDFFNSAA